MEPTGNQYELFKKYDSFGEHEYLKCAEEAANVSIGFFPLIRMQLSFSITYAILQGRVSRHEQYSMLRQIGKKKPVVFYRCKYNVRVKQAYYSA